MNIIFLMVFFRVPPFNPFKCTIISYTPTILIHLPVVFSSYPLPFYKHISDVIRSKTRAYVHLKGSPIYEKRRKVSNGLCVNIYPDVVVVPKSTKDVSEIVKISRHYQVPISVRSGGHSFLCQSIKPGSRGHIKFYYSIKQYTQKQYYFLLSR